MVACSAIDAVLALVVLKPLAMRTIGDAQRRASAVLKRPQPTPTLTHAGGGGAD
jgi:hypothetical protein